MLHLPFDNFDKLTELSNHMVLCKNTAITDQIKKQLTVVPAGYRFNTAL